jgi:hypothetical protein
METLTGVFECDGCGANCNKSSLFTPRPLREDGTTDVASYFETEPRLALLKNPDLGLVWCCRCHRMGDYCQAGEHELPATAPRFDGRMIVIAPGARAPRCLAEIDSAGKWNGSTCERAARGEAHGH